MNLKNNLLISNSWSEPSNWTQKTYHKYNNKISFNNELYINS